VAPTNKATRKRLKMITKKQLDRVKYILSELKKTEKNCGACGLFFNKSQADAQGFHLGALCGAND
jgi:CRISPR/Cas system-associated protein endoribonuclease Cas2